MSSRTTRPLRVLEIETFGRGGLIHYAFNLSTALADRGHEVHLVTAGNYELEDQPLPSGLEVHTPLRQWSQKLGDGWPEWLASPGRKAEVLADARRLANLVKRLEPDVVHLHNTNTSALAFLDALRRTGVPLVSTAHVVTPHERIALQDRVYGRIHALPNLIVAHSEIDQERLGAEFGVDRDRTTVIPHGDYGFFSEGQAPMDRVNARSKLGVDADAPVALFFGFLRSYKGLDLLLDAWPEVLERVPGATLLIAGDPARLADHERSRLERQASELGAINRFEYIPFEDVSTWFAAADLLVLPYRHISQSGVLYLALALGVPVVATAVGAWPDMLTDGESAMLVPPEDIPALADAVAKALADPGLRARLAEGGQRIADDHSWESVAEKTERAFGRLLEQRNNPAD